MNIISGLFFAVLGIGMAIPLFFISGDGAGTIRFFFGLCSIISLALAFWLVRQGPPRP